MVRLGLDGGYESIPSMFGRRSSLCGCTINYDKL